MFDIIINKTQDNYHFVKNMNNLFIRSGLAIASIVSCLLFPQLAIAQNSVGKSYCSKPSASGLTSHTKTEKIVKATLTNNSDNGYLLSIKIENNNDIIQQVTKKLKVKNALYGTQDGDLNLNADGKFSTSYIRGKMICGFQGKLTFGSGVQQKIFRK
jgi:hypothetical protein